jgi:SAM-dependent methyltransferase
MTAYEYVGSELELFKEVRNWKQYFRAQLEPHIAGDVLEVGAGLGGTTAVLFDPECSSWTCLEPDPELTEQLRAAVADLRDASGNPPRARVGTLSSLEAAAQYDCILYIDTLEHIEADREELTLAARHLRPGGRIVVLSPAHQWLYTPFDRAIGHFRRYSREGLEACAPGGLEIVSSRYLDCVGIAASLANRLLLRASMPTREQLAVWDRFMVPVSRRIDGLLGYRFGKSIMCVFRRPG